jgi:L-lactate dehydrogenase complex protein LldG
MSTAAQSRQAILDRVRAGSSDTLARDADYAALPRGYIREGALGLEERLKLMTERLLEYDAKVTECAPRDLPAAIAEELRQSGRRSFVVPEGLPQKWLAEGFEWKVDRGLDAAEIEKTEGVVTAAFCGVANSGTIVLHHSASEGRRILSLLPDWHLCILLASQVVETLPEYFVRCEQPPELVTWISGPSATADIEMTRIKGVHGPRFLVAILVHDIPVRDIPVRDATETQPESTGSQLELSAH